MKYPLSSLAPRFELTITPKEGTRYNPIHEMAHGCIASILDIEEGKRGWINYMVEDDTEYGCNPDENYWHRIHTSPIEKIEYTANPLGMVYWVKVETLNTFYEFKMIEN